MSKIADSRHVSHYTFSKFVAELEVIQTHIEQDAPVLSLVTDSRRVRPGAVFFALDCLCTKFVASDQLARANKGKVMDLHTCIIVLKNKKVITSQSVEHSICVLEHDCDNQISEIQINTTDGTNIHTYFYNDIEESLESLMNL